jgi:cysteine desulfurase
MSFFSMFVHMKPIYLDYAATTPVDERVAAKMFECLTLQGVFANPASLHAYGKQARERVETAREQVAAYINAHPSEIIWTSGATESNNLALKGAAYLYQRKGKHIITMKTEHKSVLDPCQQLEKEGYTVTYLTPETSGLLDIHQLEQAIRDDTILISIMHVNNETGIIQNLDAVAKLSAARNILFHVDAAQTPGKLPIDVTRTPIDLLSLCAHKAYGPKGIGALYLRKKPRVRVQPLLHGGGHEQGMRSGTLATHQIVGMGEAFHLAQTEMQSEVARIHTYRKRFLQHIENIANFKLNVACENAVPSILSLRFENMLADAILAALPTVIASTASACQGKSTEGSYVLRALGLTEQQAKSSVRLSFGRFTTPEDIDTVGNAILNLFK